MKNRTGYVIWLTGIAGSGKTTLGKKLYEYLKETSGAANVEFIDGDLTRQFFDDDLGYSRKDRIFNIKRIVFASMLLARNGVAVIVSNIAPYYEVRDFIRKHLPSYYQIYVKASLEKCKRADIKKLYKNAEDGKIKNVIGVDDVYEEPRRPDLVVHTDKESAEKSFARIVDFLNQKGRIVK